MTARGWAELAGVVALAVVAGAWELERAAVREQALRADQAEAQADTTRRLLTKSVGDRVVWQRRSIQQAQRGDALDAELKLERKANVDLRIRVAVLDSTLHATVTEDAAGVRAASFHVRAPPFTTDAKVALPPPPASGTMALTTTLDPLELNLRLGCGTRGPGGVAPASATVTGPTWAQLELGHVEQAPEVCSPPPSLTIKPGLGTGLWVGGAAGATAVLLLHFVAHWF
jgi:hypothetical protein